MTDYNHLYDIMIIDPEKMGLIDTIISRINNPIRRKAYDAVSEVIGGVPWKYVAVIHYRESGLSMSRHLANGDPLTDRTVHVPAGRPVHGNPPFTWEESAIDILKEKGWDKVTDWSLPNALRLIEQYNGMGYQKRGVNSPYLWSYSQNYTKGKYVADGKFDPEAVDQQCGAAVLLKLLT